MTVKLVSYRAVGDDVEPLVVEFSQQFEGRTDEHRRHVLAVAGQQLGDALFAHLPEGLVEHLFAYLALRVATDAGYARMPEAPAQQFAVQTAVGTFQLSQAWDSGALGFWQEVIEGVFGEEAPTYATDRETWVAFQEVVVRLARADVPAGVVIKNLRACIEDPEAVHPDSMYPRFAQAVERVRKGQA